MPVYKEKNRSSWYFKCCINGRQFLRRGFANKTEAKKQETLFIASNCCSPPQKKKRNPLDSLTWHDLICSYCSWYKKTAKATTYYGIHRVLYAFFWDILPDILVTKLTFSDFEKAYRVINSANLTIDTKNRRLSLLKRIFEYCKVFYGFECLDVLKLPILKNYTPIKLDKEKKKIITFDEFKRIYNEIEDDYYKLAIMTLYLYGLRLGEVMGLKVDSFDFASNTMEIYLSVSWKAGTGTYIATTPKSKESHRFIYLTTSYVSMLKEHIQKNQLKEQDFIFFSKRSKRIPISEHAFRYSLDKYCKKVDSSIHPHMFRHTNASELIEKGLSVEDVQHFEGHASKEITESVYIHQTEERKKRTLEVIEKLIKGL